jgi:hypothetical protein
LSFVDTAQEENVIVRAQRGMRSTLRLQLGKSPKVVAFKNCLTMGVSLKVFQSILSNKLSGPLIIPIRVSTLLR